MELVLPNNYVVLEEEEMMYLEGGLDPATIYGIITAVIAAGRASYDSGYAVGTRLYHSGMNKSQYQQFKRTYGWALVSIGTPFVLGMDNAVYNRLGR